MTSQEMITPSTPENDLYNTLSLLLDLLDHKVNQTYPPSISTTYTLNTEIRTQITLIKERNLIVAMRSEIFIQIFVQLEILIEGWGPSGGEGLTDRKILKKKLGEFMRKLDELADDEERFEMRPRRKVKGYVEGEIGADGSMSR